MTNPLFFYLKKMLFIIFPFQTYIVNAVIYILYFISVLQFGFFYKKFIVPMEYIVFLLIGANHITDYLFTLDKQYLISLTKIIDWIPIGISVFDNKDQCVYFNSSFKLFANKEVHYLSDLMDLNSKIVQFISSRVPDTQEFIINDKYIRIAKNNINDYFLLTVIDTTHKSSQLHLYNSIVSLINYIDQPFEIQESNSILFQNKCTQKIDKTKYVRKLIKEHKNTSYWTYETTNKVDELCEIAPIGIIIIDKDLYIHRVNEQLKQLTKTTIRNVESLVENKDQKIFIDYVNAFINNNVKVSCSFTLFNGLPVTIKMKKYQDMYAIFVIYDPLLSSIDIGYNHHQRLNLLGETVSLISHDFNNIITSILGFCDISLEECNQSSNLYKNLIHIKHHSSRASNLVRQILNMSRKNTYDSHIIKVKHSLNEFLATLGRVFLGNITIKHQSNISDEVKTHINLINFEQILFNLIKNSKDSIKDKGEISISTSLYKSNKTFTENNFIVYVGEYVEISVKDDGIGMDHNQLTSIFKPYFTTKKTGNGLGLYNVFNIIKRSKGFIRVSSKKHHGTQFKLYLPTYQEVNSQVDPIEQSKDQSLIRHKILFAEDENAIRFCITKGLRELGYSIDSVEDKKSAVNKAAINHYDILVTDVNLGHDNGIELYRTLLKTNSKLKVILISGYDIEALKKQYSFTDQENFILINKPFYINDLHHAIKSLCKDSEELEKD